MVQASGWEALGAPGPSSDPAAFQAVGGVAGRSHNDRTRFTPPATLSRR